MRERIASGLISAATGTFTVLARKRRSVAAVSMLVLQLIASSASAQYGQQGTKLVGTGSVGLANQGCSVAVSGDGNTAIIGGLNDNSEVGAAWVFTRSGGIWSQQGAKLVGTGGVGEQGVSVAVSADGNTAVVGGYDDNDFEGAAWVWTRSGGVWTQQGAKLVGTGAAVGHAEQGFSAAVSADGNTVVVGGWLADGGAGAAWVFTRSGGVWSQQGSKLVGVGSPGGYQGHSVAVSADGNTALVGGHGDNSFVGAAWVWTRSGGVWTQQGTRLVGSDVVGASEQGRSVAISADGNTALVGGPWDNSAVGAAWVWTRSGSVWSQQGAKLVGTGAVGVAVQGYSVAVSADGSIAIIGGVSDNTSGGNAVGAAWVFHNASPLDVPGNSLPGDALRVTPNPLASTSVVRFNLGRRGRVTLDLVDVAGRRARSIIDGRELSAGEHQIELKPTNLAAGIYWLRLVGRPEQAARRVVILP